MIHKYPHKGYLNCNSHDNSLIFNLSCSIRTYFNDKINFNYYLFYFNWVRYFFILIIFPHFLIIVKKDLFWDCFINCII